MQKAILNTDVSDWVLSVKFEIFPVQNCYPGASRFFARLCFRGAGYCYLILMRYKCCFWSRYLPLLVFNAVMSLHENEASVWPNVCYTSSTLWQKLLCSLSYPAVLQSATPPPPPPLGNPRSTPGAVHNSIIFSILYLECNIATSFHGLLNCMQLVVRWVEHMAPQKSIFTQEGFSSNLMVSSTTLQLDKSLWPSQILLVCRSGRGSVTPETDQTQTTQTVEHAYSTTTLHCTCTSIA